MGTRIAVQLAQQFGRSVGHLRLLSEIRGRVYHAQQLGDPFNFVQVADDSLHIGQTVETGLACGLVALLDGYIYSQFSPVRLPRRVPAHE